MHDFVSNGNLFNLIIFFLFSNEKWWCIYFAFELSFVDEDDNDGDVKKASSSTSNQTSNTVVNLD